MENIHYKNFVAASNAGEQRAKEVLGELAIPAREDKSPLFPEIFGMNGGKWFMLCLGAFSSILNKPATEVSLADILLYVDSICAPKPWDDNTNEKEEK